MVSKSIPIRIHPANPKIFEFRDRPLVLLTATEHYGAVMNRPFRYRRYLKDASEKGMTLSRLFLLFRELQNQLNPYSTCKPESEDYVSPYLRTGPEYAYDGELKYDLDKWNPEFFGRLHGFLSRASELGIIIEVTLLSNTYGKDVWNLNPLNTRNNVNGMEPILWHEYNTLRHTDLTERHAAFVRKIVEETNRYDNIFYEICNEPGAGPQGMEPPTTTDEVNEWQRFIAAEIVKAERGLPNRHLIAGQEAFTYEPWEQSSDLTFDNFPADIVNVHPLPNTTYRGTGYDMGPFMAKRLNLRAVRDFCLATAAERKPVNLDEDNTASRFRNPAGWTIHRKRAWMTLMCGCHYDFIDFSIQNYLETGTPGSRRHIRKWLKNLSEFIHSVDLAGARPIPGIIAETPGHTIGTALEAGEEYCVYIADEREFDEPGQGSAIKGDLALILPKGIYEISFYSPTEGEYFDKVVAGGGEPRLSLPEFKEDMAIKIKRR